MSIRKVRITYQCKNREYIFFADVFEETFKKHNQLDIVVNNAAIQDESLWEKMIQVNYVSGINVMWFSQKDFYFSFLCDVRAPAKLILSGIHPQRCNHKNEELYCPDTSLAAICLSVRCWITVKWLQVFATSEYINISCLKLSVAFNTFVFNNLEKYIGFWW